MKTHLQHPMRIEGVSACGMARDGIGVLDTREYFRLGERARCSHCDRIYGRMNPLLVLNSLECRALQK